MTSIMDSGAALENSRSRRLPTFDHMNLLRPSMTFSSSFGVGRSAWGTNGSIWRTANHFTDGAVDEEAVPDIRSRALQEELHSSGKTGSGSLLLSSESEGRSARSNVPWDTAVSSIQSNLSRPQNELISPTRQRVLASDSTVNGLSAQSASAYRSILSSDTSQSGEYIGGPTTQQNSHSALSNRSRQTFERSGFPEFQPAQSSVQKREQYNNSNFSSNGGLSASNSLSLRQAELAVGDGSSKQYANGVPRTTNSAMNVNFDSHARTAAVGFNTRFNSNFVANGQTHASNLQQYHSLNGTPVQDDSIDQQENQLSMSFNRLGFEDGQTQWNNGAHAQPQYPPSRQPAEINGPFARELTKTKFGYLTDERSNQALVNNASDSAQEFGYHYLPNYYKNSSFGDQATASPTASEYRRNLQSPLYSTTGTPPTGPESMRSASGSGLSSRASNGHSTLLDRKLRSLEPYSHDQQYIHANPLHPQMHYPPPPYDYATYASTMRMNPLANPYSTTSFFNAATASLPPRYPSREHDTSQIVRSPLLEDFRTNSKTNKRYELKDIYNHVVEFSGDQHGSRFIQQKLETANSDEKDQIFTEILPDSLQLMTDVFGNYVIQKLFEHGNQSQKKLLANQMKGHVFSLSLQMYGCRVVQKALEHILTDQQASMVKELESHVSKCVKDQNGNHVIQKAIERVPAEHIQFIVDAFHEQVQRLATHPYGCRVIQRMLEHCERPAKQAILHEMHQCVPTLITDQFGNYVIQHVIERGDPEDKYRVVSIVQAQLLIYSKHKFASNVVEKSIEFSEESQRKDILQQLTVTNEKGESPVFGLMRDQYGNYVIQKVLSQLQGARRQALVDQIKAQLVNLKKFSYGKQITAIEKLIFDNDNSSLSASSQSSALQSTNVSTNASTVEGRITPPRVQISKALQPHETQVALPLTLGQPRS